MTTILSPTAPVSVEQSLAAVLADVVGVEQVPLDAHFFDDLGADSMLMARFCARVRKRDDLPSVSIKDVYQHPTIERLATAFALQGSPLEGPLGEVLADVVGVDRVSVGAHFFDDLGADSMLMARFCARVRKRPNLPPVSIKDVYAHPTVRSLAAALPDAVAEPVAPAPQTPAAEPPARASTREYVACGVLQLLVFIGYFYALTLVFLQTDHWILDASGLVDAYLRAAVFGGALFIGMCTLPILAKWILIGRWTPRQIPVWSLAYVRFWLVKTLVQANPIVLFFDGSPLYVLYLRALGAKIGRGAAIFTRHVPVCTDLMTIGEGTVVRKDAYLNCYRVHAGVIQTGAVTLGRNVVVGEMTVLDIDTALGDGAQLGHVSSLHMGQAVPAGEYWHGSPGRRAEVDHRAVPPADCGTARRAVYGTLQLLRVLLVNLPLVVGGVAVVFTQIPSLVVVESAPAFRSWTFYLDALVTSTVVYFGLGLVVLLVMVTVPRVLNRFLEPGKAYPLYGMRYSLHRTIFRFTNNKFFTTLFGDSSYIVPYLRAIGYRLTPLVQTGSNFGTEVKHDNPFLVSVGTGTVCASELSVINADYSNTSFRLSPARIGAHNFLGNGVTYPAQGKTGDNCLLAIKVLVPMEGEVREGVGLLGSPSFEIPRTVERDSKFVRMATDADVPRRLAAKNRHNLVTMGIHLASRWFVVAVLTMLYMGVWSLEGELGTGLVALIPALAVLPFTLLFSVFVERAVVGFRPVRPRCCSIYEIDFWRMERLLKNTSKAHIVLNGTPFKSAIWRLLGVRVGRRLFDDGCGMADKAGLVAIGDDVTLNAGSILQCHSQEDYAFKNDRIAVGSGCTLGVGALAHYGVRLGGGAVLAPDSFLMKGEEVPSHERWGGNPAREMPAVDPFALQSPPRPVGLAHGGA